MAVINLAKGRRRPIRWRRHALGYLFISPWIVGFLVFIAGPMIASLILSFTDYDLITDPIFAGFDNFRRLANDPMVPKSLFNTAYYTVLSVPARLAVALAMALVLNMKLKYITFWGSP